MFLNEGNRIKFLLLLITLLRIYIVRLLHEISTWSFFLVLIIEWIFFQYLNQFHRTFYIWHNSMNQSKINRILFTIKLELTWTLTPLILFTCFNSISISKLLIKLHIIFIMFEIIMYILIKVDQVFCWNLLLSMEI